MSLWAKLPIAVAPGMGLNAFFAYTIVLGMGYTWQFALTAVFLEGILFIILSLLNIREAIINSIPTDIKKAISVGIGLFIALIGLVNAGIIETGMVSVGNHQLDGVIVKLGNMKSAAVLVVVIGLFVSAALLYRKFNAALLVGIIVATLVGIPLGLTHLPADGKLISLPPSIAPVFFKMQFSSIFSWDMLIILFTLLTVNLFDTVGTLIGCCTAGNLLDPSGKIPNVKKALLADAVGTTAAAIFGTSVATAYIESASGIASGGKTGLTSFTVAMLFVLALFFAPLFSIIPAAATAPALIIVGYLMMREVVHIDFTDITHALPAFLTIVMMPFTYSIAEGIVFGMVSYTALKIMTGNWKDVSITMYVLAVLFLFSILIK
jgi:AGZA family xanthine/uracil permease-like MFS transporter